MSLHKQRTHPGPDVPGCFGCHVSSLQLVTEPTNEGQAKQYRFQKDWSAEFHNGDREAYKRLRANGTQPPRIAGSANLERHAQTKFEIESGFIARDQRGLKDALVQCSDGGLDPTKPQTKPKAAG